MWIKVVEISIIQLLKITLISSDNSKLILYNLKWILADKNSWKLKTVAVMKNTMGNLLEDFE